MAGKKKGGFGGGIVHTVIAAIVICGVMLGLWNALPSSEGSLYDQAQVKSKALEEWYKSGKWSELPFPGLDPVEIEAGDFNPTIPKIEVEDLLKDIEASEPERVPYNRDEWKHWSTAPGAKSCWDVREQVLFDEAVKGSVKLLDKNDKPTDDVKQACKITEGEWIGPYTGKTFTNPSDLDIDHLIPLSYAAKQGGQAWDAEKKEEYANDLSNPQHLIAVEAGANRQKGDQGPSTWKPSNKAYHCSYATSWVDVTAKWKLTMPEADRKAIQEMLGSC